MKAKILTATFLFFGLLQGQTVQYASSVIKYSSTVSSEEYHVQNILGKPDARPGEKSPGAWLPSNANSYYEFVRVGFEKPMKIRQIAVFENHYPGSIWRIYAYDENGHLIGRLHKEKPKPLPEKYRVLRAVFPLTERKVKFLEIQMKPYKVPGPNQIDAIAISDNSKPIPDYEKE